MIPRRIVVLGSSSVHGYGDVEQGGFVNRFRLWHEAQHPKNIVYQLGLFGETTESLIERLSLEAPRRRPHLVVLYPGFNDIHKEGSEIAKSIVSLDCYRQLMLTLVSASQKIAPTIVLTGFPFDQSKTTPYRESDWFFLESDAERYTSVLKEVCWEEQCLMLDYFHIWQSLDWKTLLFKDGLHANPDGHQLLFEQLRDFLLGEFSEG